MKEHEIKVWQPKKGLDIEISPFSYENERFAWSFKNGQIRILPFLDKDKKEIVRKGIIDGGELIMRRGENPLICGRDFRESRYMITSPREAVNRLVDFFDGESIHVYLSGGGLEKKRFGLYSGGGEDVSHLEVLQLSKELPGKSEDKLLSEILNEKAQILTFSKESPDPEKYSSCRRSKVYKLEDWERVRDISYK